MSMLMSISVSSRDGFHLELPIFKHFGMCFGCVCSIKVGVGMVLLPGLLGSAVRLYASVKYHY